MHKINNYTHAVKVRSYFIIWKENKSKSNIGDIVFQDHHGYKMHQESLHELKNGRFTDTELCSLYTFSNSES